MSCVGIYIHVCCVCGKVRWKLVGDSDGLECGMWVIPSHAYCTECLEDFGSEIENIDRRKKNGRND